MTDIESLKPPSREFWVYDKMVNQIRKVEGYAYPPPEDLDEQPNPEHISYYIPELRQSGFVGKQIFNSPEECKEATLAFLESSIKYWTGTLAHRRKELEALKEVTFE